MNIERVFRVLWGPNLENALDFAWPTVGSSPLHWRVPRAESQLVTRGAASVAWITGRYYRLKVLAQFFGGPQNFGGTGLQAFIDWAADSNTFTLVPNIAVPALTVPGCYLEGPFTSLSPTVGQGEVQDLALTILHPTSDLGLAWRGLWFEWVAGQSLADPVSFLYSRSAIAYEMTPQGYLLSHPVDNICDGHYPDRTGGLQTMLAGMAITNDIPNPEDLTNASWTPTNGAVTPNNAKAPDQNVTADLFVENTAVSVIHFIGPTAGIAVTSGDQIVAQCFVRDGGRFNGIFWVNDNIGGGGANRFGAQFNLHTGTITGQPTLGTGTIIDSQIIPLAGGWFCVWIRGSLGTVTSVFPGVRLGDAGGNFTYTGDGASGMYVWGVTQVHGAPGAKLFAPGDYTPTTSGLDTLKTFWGYAPQSMFVVTDFIEGGSARANNGAGLFVIGGDGTTSFTRFDNFGTNQYRFSHQTPTVALASTAGGVPAIGQRVQHLGNIFLDGSVEMRQTIAGGAETTGGRTSAIPFSSAWSNPFLGLIHANFCGGLRRIAIGPGTQPTLTQALLV